MKKHDRVGYDVIGDIHGQATRLEALLSAMGYVKSDGTWTHPTLLWHVHYIRVPVPPHHQRPHLRFVENDGRKRAGCAPVYAGVG